MRKNATVGRQWLTWHSIKRPLLTKQFIPKKTISLKATEPGHQRTFLHMALRTKEVLPVLVSKSFQSQSFHQLKVLIIGNHTTIISDFGLFLHSF